MSDKVLTLKGAAKLLRVTSDTVETLLESGQLAGRQIEGEWRTTRRAVLFYIDGGAGRADCCPPGCGAAEGAKGCCSGLPGCC